MTCCVSDSAAPRWPSFETTARTATARAGLCDALLRRGVRTLVLSGSRSSVDPLASLFLESHAQVLVCDQVLLDALAALPLRRPGRRGLAQLLARLPAIPAWRAALHFLDADASLF